MALPPLLMIAPAPVQRLPGGRLRLDAKFVEGMRAHQALWDGPCRVILWEGGAIPFGLELGEGEVGFDLTILPRGAPVAAAHLAGAGVVLASADMAETLDLAGPAASVGAKLVYGVEYTLATRLRIVALDRALSWPRKLRSVLWHLGQERRRRRAFQAAAGLQLNGYPAEAAYAALSPAPMLYLDGRMRAAMMAGPAQMAARAANLAGGGPLRLVHSGRLEALKGAQDLVPVARALVAVGVDFTLDIFGTGALEAEIAQGIAAHGLSGRMRLHAPLPFEEGLVPHLRDMADVFLSCHRQADPSCSYLEAMGCGLPVVGYDNAMWGRMAQVSGAGWAVPMGRPQALAARIAGLPRTEIAAASTRALAFAQAHDFEKEFSRRMQHLTDMALSVGASPFHLPEISHGGAGV